MWPALPAPEYYGGSAPPGPFSGRRAYPRSPGRMPAPGEPEPGGSRVHRDSLAGVGARLCPSGPPRLRRSPSPWPPGQRTTGRRLDVPSASTPIRTRRARPVSTRFEPVHALKGVVTPVPRVLLSVSLAGPAPSGSTRTSRLCQDRSRPPRHHPDQAVLSYSDLLRQATGEGLSPPLEPQRLTAHVKQHQSPWRCEAFLADRLTYQGLLQSRQRHAARSSSRDRRARTGRVRMKNTRCPQLPRSACQSCWSCLGFGPIPRKWRQGRGRSPGAGRRFEVRA
jgi:hypothetical protein